MDTERFHRIVAQAIDGLPDEYLERMENIDVVVEEQPSRYQLRTSGVKSGHTLLGLYEGVPLIARGAHYNFVLPDKITIFQQPIEEKCRTENEIIDEVRDVVRHEIAHHFGIGDAKLSQIEREKRKKRKTG